MQLVSSNTWFRPKGLTPFRLPGGGDFLYRQKVTKERLKGFALKYPTRGFPLDLPKDGANAPYPLIPAGLFIVPCGGYTPSGLRPTGPACGGAALRADLVALRAICIPCGGSCPSGFAYGACRKRRGDRTAPA